MHAEEVNTTTDGQEARRVAKIYAAYRRSPRRRRAWSAVNPGNVAIREELLKRILEVAALQIAGTGRILDAGCGTGYWLERMVASGVAPERLAGVDVLAHRLRARPTLPAGMELRQADVRALPYEDATFDVVLMLTVLSSLETRSDVVRAAEEAARVLSRGGMLVVYEPRLPNPLNRATRRFRASELVGVLGSPRQNHTVTLLPAVARRLGRRGVGLYPRLVHVSPLRSHRLSVWIRR